MECCYGGTVHRQTCPSQTGQWQEERDDENDMPPGNSVLRRMQLSCKGMASLSARIALTIPRAATCQGTAATPFMMAMKMACMLPCRITEKTMSIFMACRTALFRISTHP